MPPVAARAPDDEEDGRLGASALEPPAAARPPAVRTAWQRALDHAPRVALVIAIAIALTRAAGRILPTLRGSSFEEDAWLWVARLRDSDGALDFLAREVLGAEDHFRPLMHLILGAWARFVGFDTTNLARALFGVVVLLHALYYVFFRRLGVRAEAAALASLLLFVGPGVFFTYAIVQFNDLVIAAVFSFAAMIVCLGPRRAGESHDAGAVDGRTRVVLRAALVTALGLLAASAHESGCLAGPLLLVALAYRDGLRAARRWLWRPEPIALLVVSVAVLSLRLARLRSGQTGFIGAGHVGANLAHAALRVASELRSGPRLPALLAACALLAARAAVVRRWPAVALVRGALFAALWFVVAYSLFSLNLVYQASSYLNVASVGPSLLFAVPLAGALFRPARAPLLRAGAAAAVVLLVVAPARALRLVPAQHRSGPVLDAIARHLPPDPAARLDVWVVEVGPIDRSPPFFRSELERSMQASLDENLAVSLRFPDRVIGWHTVDAGTFAHVRPRPTDVTLITVERGAPMRVYELAHDAPARRLFGPPVDAAPPGVPPAPATPRPPRPDEPPEAAVAAFWADYARGDSAAMDRAWQALAARSPASPALAAMHAGLDGPGLLPRLRALGRKRDVARVLGRVVDEHPDDVHALCDLAKAENDLGDDEALARAVRRTLEALDALRARGVYVPDDARIRRELDDLTQ